MRKHKVTEVAEEVLRYLAAKLVDKLSRACEAVGMEPQTACLKALDICA